FLLGAYQFLLDWHKEYYTTHKPSKKEYEAIFNPVGGLSTTIKKQILLNNIYGVDIDANAVEVTKLSLLLKCMEGETSATINHQLSFFKERLLPTLDHNIKCGNSLIDLDYFDFKLDLEPTLDLLKSIKPFSWKQNFPNVFAIGGFDAVIGNPPYVRQETLGSLKEYFSAKYRVYHGMADLYSYFIEKGVQLLKPDGRFGIIVANKWMRANYGGALRTFLMKQDIESIIDFGDLPVFASATTYPCILLIRNDEPADSFTGVNVDTLSFSSLEKYVTENSMTVEKSSLTTEAWNLTSQTEAKLMQKLKSAGIPLGEYVDGKIFYGIKTGLNEAFIITKEQRDELIRQDPKSAEIIKPFLLGKDLFQYHQKFVDRYLIFTRRGININSYPAIKEYLLKYKVSLTPRPKDFTGDKWQGRKAGTYKWYEIQDSVDYYLEFEKPKITWGNLCIKPSFTMVDGTFYINAPSVIISVEDYYLLGLMNSNGLWYYLNRIAAGRSGGYIEAKPVYVSQLPVVLIITDADRSSVKLQIENYAKSLLTLHGNLVQSVVPEMKSQIEASINHQKDKLNQLVYQLYGLTEEEFQIIEDAIR
ncbi:partial Type IIS restriction enzyme Eco57I, partial [uncultured bacterium]